MMSDRFVLRELSRGDAAAVAQIHESAFPDAAMTAFGQGVVRRYYDWLLEDVHDSHPVGIESAGRLIGFCFGGVYYGAMQGFLLRNGGYLVMSSLIRPWLLVQQHTRQRAFTAARIVLRVAARVLRRAASERQPVSDHGLARDRSFGILAIAVSPSARGIGAGRKLMQHAEREAVLRGYGRMDLTVHPSNSHAVRFYESLGWERVEPDPAWAGKMTKRLQLSMAPAAPS
jgi:ribosomal protein S18 acetylase RimI-like enzyme